MNPTRLLLITPDFPPNLGGVARYLGLLARYLGNRLSVVTSVVGASKEPFVSVVERPLLAKRGWPKWCTTVWFLIKNSSHYDMVITSHIIPFGTAAWVASWITRKPYLVIAHGLDVRLASRSFLKHLLTRQILKKARVVVTNSQALAYEMANTFSLTLPLTVYPCLEPIQNFSLKKKQEVFFRLLTISRLISRKGHMQVLMALSHLKQSGRIGQFHYDIVGDGPMRESLEALTQELNLSEVSFHGAVSDEQKNLLYSQADVFVMPVQNDPIDKEGFGMVFLEAAQFAVPSISSKIEGIDEAILDQQTGCLIEPGNIEELGNTIAQLAHDVDLRISLGRHAQQRVKSEFTCDMQFAKLEPYL